MSWADKLSQALEVPVLLVPGNHEFYRNPRSSRHSARTFTSCIDALRERAHSTAGRVTFLHRDTAVVAGIRWIGATLWADFALFGNPVMEMLTARAHMTDFRGAIAWREGEQFTPEHALEEHRRDLAFLAAECQRPSDEPRIVLTHHAPSAKSIAPQRATDPLSAAYASHLDRFVEACGAAVWLHGHTHHSSDYRIALVRVICNARGYYGHEINRTFDPNLVVEVR